MTFDKLAEIMPGIEQASQMATPQWLAGQVRQLAEELGRRPLCVEVGTWCGFTALAMADAGAYVVCVDTFDGHDDQTRERATQLATAGIDSCLGRLLANALALGTGRIVSVCGRSVEVAVRMPQRCADLVFIDADHSRVAVEADLDAWSPVLRWGGVLCGHDGNQTDVHAAVSAFSGRTGWILDTSGPDTLWHMRKGVLTPSKKSENAGV